ncbi:MAG: DUF167 domain-containing protein [Nitrospira sp.]
MKIYVKAKAGSKENKITPPPLKLIKTDTEPEYYVVSVKEEPKEGKANDAIARLLAKHFSVTLSQVRLLRGSTSKIKVFDILDAQ